MRLSKAFYFLCITVALASPSHFLAQNIPPMIGTDIKNPGIKIPNPMEQTGTQRQSDHSQQSPTKAQENEISKFIEGLSSAYGSKNSEVISSLYSQEPGLVIFWDGVQLSGSTVFSQSLNGWLAQSDTLSFDLLQPDIHVLGRFAWVSSQCRVRAFKGGVETAQAGTLTWILEKKRSSWVILHEHRTLLPLRAN
jgi:ketosteroid isomerase-like protein